MEDIKGVFKKTINIDAIGLSPTELNNRNITDIPIEKMYYAVACNRQIIIHKLGSKYAIYTMNWLPKFHTENHIFEFKPNHWQRIVTYSKVDDAIRIYRKYVKEMIGEDTKNNT